MTSDRPWLACGLLYVFVYIGGLVNELWIVPHAASVSASSSWLKASVALTLAAAVADSLIGLLLLELLEPVAPRLLRAALVLRLLFAGMLALCVLPLLPLLREAPEMSTYLETWRQDMWAARHDLFALALAPFGLSLWFVGKALLRGCAPGVGAWLMLAGIAYGLGTGWRLVAPDVAAEARMSLFIVPLVAELSLTFWLLKRGLRETIGTGLDRQRPV